MATNQRRTSDDPQALMLVHKREPIPMPAPRGRRLHTEAQPQCADPTCPCHAARRSDSSEGGGAITARPIGSHGAAYNHATGDLTLSIDGQPVHLNLKACYQLWDMLGECLPARWAVVPTPYVEEEARS